MGDGRAQQRVLIVEDDPQLRDMLARVLSRSGYGVETVADGHRGLHQTLTRPYDALIVDRGLPGVDGLDLVRRLRRHGVLTPLLMLSAYGTLADRVAGLDAGAEDYLVKPFELEELLARLRALLRRHDPTGPVMPFGAGRLDVAARTVLTADGRTVELSAREGALLATLAAKPTRVFGRDELRRRVFDAAESSSIVDTYVYYLRRKLGAGAIRTVRGLGYRVGTL
jgi:two-component system, OmpR family, response regulator QseB